MSSPGKTSRTYLKHELLAKVATAQVAAWRSKHPYTPFAMIDMHAGDAHGVQPAQLSLFGPYQSTTTAELALRLATTFGALGVYLCERDTVSRAALAMRCPGVTLLHDHADLLTALPHAIRWACILNDPNGPKDQGIAVLHALSSRLSFDVCAVYNALAVHRVLSVSDTTDVSDNARRRQIEGLRRSKENYAWMEDAQQWGLKLGRRYVGRSRLVRASSAFHYQVLVIANHLSRVICPPHWEVVAC